MPGVAWSRRSTSTFTSWQEDPAYGEDAPLPRLASAQVAFSYAGALNGSSNCIYAMAYAADGSGTSLGYETITGELDGRTGSFVVHHTDQFTTSGVSAQFEVIAGSGTDQLSGISGRGSYQVGHGTSEWTWTFDYELG